MAQRTDTIATGADLATLIPSWGRALAAANRAPRTIEVYTASARQFYDFLVTSGMPTRVDAVSREYVEAFISSILERAKPGTASVRFRALQRFWGWAEEEGEVTASPMAKMSAVLVPEQPVPIIDEDAVKRLLATCKAKSFENLRDEALLRVFLDTGARLSEVALATVEDLDLDQGMLTVLGKGRRLRSFQLGDKALQALDRYLRARRTHARKGANLTDDDGNVIGTALWIGPKGALTPSGVRQVIRRRGAQAGIEGLHPHMLRHLHAHDWMASGGSEVGLMRKMGWRSRAMLGRYAASTADARARAESRRLGLGDKY